MPQANSQVDFANGAAPPANVFIVRVYEDGAEKTIILPSVIGVLGNFGGHNLDRKPWHERSFERVDSENFQQVMSEIAPMLSLSIEGLGRIELVFTSIEDFAPDAIIRQVPQLSEVHKLRQLFAELLARLDGNFALRDLVSGLLEREQREPALLAQLDDELADESSQDHIEAFSEGQDTTREQEATHE